MKLSFKWAIGSCTTLIAAIFGWCVFYPNKSALQQQTLRVVGAVAVDKFINELEERVGKADVALEHYKTAQQAKRNALINLKTLKADCERKVSECKASIAALQAQGNQEAIPVKQAELAAYERQVASLTESVAKAESDYKQFNLFLKNKKTELDTLKNKTQTLRSELNATGGDDAGYAIKHARELEEEIKSACSRLEAEMDVQQIDEEMN